MMALRRALELGACVTHRTHKSVKFRRSSTHTPRDKCGFRLLFWGYGGQTRAC
ncbi:hypothetical protein DPMN_186618 [Dreissena polymorpha]|uniref:Uncharacterized protein n=1 Tax=Dreissena polymorpha TaxID=45954 RepID=A0A9D4DP06_DREPO|nr:hypothetical protein DPMN_186618 [Dreissena polymorpha]